VKRLLLIFGFFAYFSSFALADDVAGNIIDQQDFDPNVPYYQKLVPSWAAGIRVAVPSVPIKAAIGSIDELFLEKLLHFQKIGILSIGAHLGVAPLKVSRYDNIKYGTLLRYQLHVVRNQILVPTAALVFDAFRLKNPSGTVTTVSSPTILLGAMLNLGFFDEATSREGHQSLGLLRSYLTLEVRPLDLSAVSYADSNGNAVHDSAGTIWYWGIRLEFE
jgi:hypothetical protein